MTAPAATAAEARPVISDVVDLMPEIMTLNTPWRVDAAVLYRENGHLLARFERGNWNSSGPVALPPSPRHGSNHIAARHRWLCDLLDRVQHEYETEAVKRFDRHNGFHGGR